MQKAVPDQDAVKKWIEISCVFFSVFAFLLTFGLPIALMKMQRARVLAEIERRRVRDGAISQSIDTTS